MKKQFLITLGAAALLVGCGTTESELGMGAKFDDLPQSVQSSVRQQIGEAQVLDIDMERRTGNEIYEITYEANDGMKHKLHVRQDGTILGDRQAGARGVMNEAAGAFRGEAKDAEVEVNTDDSEVEVEGEIQQQGSAQGEFKASGTTQQGTSADYSSSSAQPSASASYDSSSQSSFKASSSDTSAQASTSDAEFEAEASSSEFEAEADVEADAELAPRDRIEANKQVRGGAEGLLQKGSLEANEPAGAESEASAELSTESSSSEKSAEIDASAEAESSSSEQSSVELESAGAEKRGTTSVAAGTTTISFNQLPEAVKNALRDHGGETMIRTIEQKNVYEIQFKDADKHGHKKVCVTEDGKMLEK